MWHLKVFLVISQKLRTLLIGTGLRNMFLSFQEDRISNGWMYLYVYSIPTQICPSKTRRKVCTNSNTSSAVNKVEKQVPTRCTMPWKIVMNHCAFYALVETWVNIPMEIRQIYSYFMIYLNFLCFLSMPSENRRMQINLFGYTPESRVTVQRTF